MTATPLPENLTPPTGGEVDPTDLARRTQANFDALALAVGGGIANVRVGVSGIIPFGVAAVQSTAWVTVTHNLGVVPKYIHLTQCYVDGGLFTSFVDYVGSPPNATTFNFVVRDENGILHGPGFLAGIGWVVVG